MINLVVCSLGAIKSSENSNEISEETLQMISELHSEGIRFAVVTGMNYDAVAPLFGNLKKDIIFACNDGGVVIYQDKVLSKTPIDRLICLDIEREVSEDLNYRVTYGTEKGLYITTHDYDFIRGSKEEGKTPEFIKDTKELHGDITKITIYSKKEFNEQSYSYFYNKWAKGANVAISNPNQINITAQYVNRSIVVSLIQHMFAVSAEDTVIFGAEYRDIEMFKHSYFSYALQSADGEVKRSAQYITENIPTILQDIMRMI